MKHKKGFVFFFIFMVFFVLHDNYGQENAFFVNFGSPAFQVPTLSKVGIGYEKKINDFSSYLFTGDLAGNIVLLMDSSYGWETTFQIDFLAHLRWYPFNTALKRFFLDIGAGCTLFLITTENTAASVQFPLQAMVGWRFAGKKYFIQPWIGYNISFGEIKYPKYFYNEYEGLFKYGLPCAGLAAGFLF